MFCKNCGNQLTDNSVVCSHCGASIGQEGFSCPQCGNHPAPGATFCNQCGYRLQNAPLEYVQRSRLVAGLLAIFLGSLGIHNFYLGFQNRALTQLLVSVIGGILSCGIATLAITIWSLVEGIQILTGTINYDAQGQPLKD